MIEMEVVGLVYVVAFIFGIVLALAPLFCWIHLRRIRRKQEEDAQRVNSHLWEMRRSLAQIDETLKSICDILNKK